MASSRVSLESYLIPLEEINRATENFNQQRCIGGGGFGAVYKGQLSENWQNRTAAIKRLGRDSYQGEHEFRNELEMISRFNHENIISFIGYCDEGGEMIIVYEYASNGSLDHHLQDPNKMCHITWAQRLKICIGAARGLNYLHSGVEEHHRIIHRDVKSANILLDENLVAKICDFGLSKLGPMNQPNTELNTKVAGTQFYLDPTYHESHILRKESDVYSFGVVLFEMLSGMLVYSERSIDNGRSEILMNFVRQNDDDILRKLIDPHIRDQIGSRSFFTFKKIAYKCISLTLKERPTMKMVIDKIEEALLTEEPQTLARSLRTEFKSNPQTPPLVSQKDHIDALIQCVMEEVGFSCGIPVAAFTMYICFLHWKSFEAVKTTVFDRLLDFVLSAVEEVRNDNNQMAYWLSNASTLLILIEKSIKHNGASLRRKKPRPHSRYELRTIWELPYPTSPFGRMAMKFLPSLFADDPYEPEEPSLEVVQQVQAKYPALLFKEQLLASVGKMYGIIHDNIKRELGSLLALCIKVPLRSRQSVGKDSQFHHWLGIVDGLSTLLNSLKENFVSPIIVRKIFPQIFSYINMMLFNSILLRRDCCTFSNGEYVKAGLAELELWCSQTKEEYVGSAWDELKHIRQAIGFLVIHQKDNISYDELIKDLCPVLSIQQLYRICTIYSDDINNTLSVSPDVISSMRVGITEESYEYDASSSTFLLDDSSSIPFSIDDLSNSLQVEDFANVKPAVQLGKHPAFVFLYNY